MAQNGRPSIVKRQKEQARLEKQRDKAATRNQRKIDKQNGVVSSSDGSDEATAPPADAASDAPANNAPANK